MEPTVPLIPTEQVLKPLLRELKSLALFPHFTGERNVLIREGAARMIQNEMMKRDELIQALQLELMTLKKNQKNNE